MVGNGGNGDPPDGSINPQQSIKEPLVEAEVVVEPIMNQDHKVVVVLLVIRYPIGQSQNTKNIWWFSSFVKFTLPNGG